MFGIVYGSIFQITGAVALKCYVKKDYLEISPLGFSLQIYQKGDSSTCVFL